MNQVQQLEQGLVELAIEVPAAAQEKLLAYAALLYKWNRTYSLTALRDESKAVSHHLLDSLAILPFVPAGRCTISMFQGPQSATAPSSFGPR